jgi:hypothetical protein
MRLVERLRLLNIALPILSILVVAAGLVGFIAATARGDRGLMAFILLLAALLALAHWALRRQMEGSVKRLLRAPGFGPCPGCGYPAGDRPSDICPECGDRTPRAQIRLAWDRRLGYWWWDVPF